MKGGREGDGGSEGVTERGREGEGEREGKKDGGDIKICTCTLCVYTCMYNTFHNQ